MLTIKQIQEITQGILIQGNPDTKVRGASIDSRTAKKGDVFIAIKGERLDGHRFIREAQKKGVAGIVVQKKLRGLSSIPMIRVKDTTQALGQLAAFHRRRFSIPIIAITGSAGKTTTKEMIAHVLESRYKVLKNRKSENNQYGLPLTLLRLNSSYDIAVLELGTNQFGDIDYLSQIVDPTVAIYTNIGESHLQGLKSPRGVLREKTRLMNYLPPHGDVIFNQDDQYLKNFFKKRLPQTKMTYAIHHKAAFQARQIQKSQNDKITFMVNKKRFLIKTPVHHNIYNALAAICCGHLFKISYNSMKIKLNAFLFDNSRQQVKKIGQLTLIDDTYNSNPLSLKSAIRTLDSFLTKGRKICVCGDMLELGKTAYALHRDIGKTIARSSIDLVLTTGRYTKEITKIVQKSSVEKQAFHCRDIDEVNQRLKKYCQKGDVVLVKGSRATRMDRTVSFVRRKMK